MPIVGHGVLQGHSSLRMLDSCPPVRALSEQCSAVGSQHWCTETPETSALECASLLTNAARTSRERESKRVARFVGIVYDKDCVSGEARGVCG